MKETGMKSFLPDWRPLLQRLKKEILVGLDIGASSVKMVEIARRENSLALVKAEAREILRTDNSVFREEEILPALKELLKGVAMERSKFVVSFNHPEMAMRILTIPPMPKNELIQGIRLESKNYFPFSVENSYLDVGRPVEVWEKGVKKSRLAVAVAPGKAVAEILNLLKRAGIQPSSLVPAPSALQKLFEMSEAKAEKTVCYVNVGAEHSDLLIFKDKGLVFCRKLPVAGRSFTREMTGVLMSDAGKTQLTLEEAEKLKREIGIPAPGESRKMGDKISSSQIASMLRSPLEQLVSEIDRSFSYYREETGGESIERIYLLGGGALLKGLVPALSEALGIEIQLGDQLEGLKVQPQLVAPDDGLAPFAVSLGAALTEGRGINLLPPEMKEATKQSLRRGGLESGVLAALLLLVFAYAGMKIQLGNFQKRIAVAKLEMSGLATGLSELKVQIEAHNLMAREPYWGNVFGEVSQLIPSGIYLTEMAWTGGAMVLKGVIVSTEKQAALSEFISGLEQGGFSRVKLVTTKEREDKVSSEFELVALLDSFSDGA